MKEFVKMSREITQTGIEGGKEKGTQVSANAADGPLHLGQGKLGAWGHDQPEGPLHSGQRELRDMSKFIKDQSRLG